VATADAQNRLFFCAADAGQDDALGCALKKMVKPSRRGSMVERLVGSYLVSERHACRVLCVYQERPTATEAASIRISSIPFSGVIAVAE
jgi:hypothetical protein